MRSFTLFILTTLAGACATVSDRGTSQDLAPHHGVAVVRESFPHPIFEKPFDWRVVRTERQDVASVAEVVLERPVMDGRMLLLVIPSDGLTPQEHAESIRDQLVDLLPEALISDVAPGIDDLREAAFVGLWPRDAPADARIRRVKVIVREIPGHPGFLALCEGFWPQNSHEFLLAPLHQACKSVRPPQ